MHRWLLNRRVLAAVLAFAAVLVLMTLTAHERQRITRFEEWVFDAFAPVQRFTFQAADAVRGVGQRVAELHRLHDENERLREELQELRERELVMAEVLRRYDRLTDLLALKQRLGVPVIAANVIGRNPDRWLEIALLDVGRADGVSVNMVAVHPDGLVGRVTQTSRHTATVMLLTDPQSGVGVMAQDSRDIGVAEGDPNRPGYLKVRFFSRAPQVAEGETLLTSGYGEVFPPGLVVGTVEEISEGPQGLSVTAWVRPAADLDRLSEVLILETTVRLPETPGGTRGLP